MQNVVKVRFFLIFIFFWLSFSCFINSLEGKRKKKADEDVTAQLESSQRNNLHAICVERAGTGFLAI